MRTNSIDATCFRCLAEYNNLIVIYSKLMKKNYEHLIKEYLTELNLCDTPKEVRTKHRERINFVNEKIDEFIATRGKKKIGGLVRADTQDADEASKYPFRDNANFKM